MRRAVFGLAALGCLASGAWAAAASYAMKGELSLPGPWISVGDLLDPAPDTAVAQVKIKHVGAPGKDVEVSREVLLMKVHDARLGVELQVSGTASLVHATLKIVPASEISGFAEKYIRERLEALSGVAEVSVKATASARDLGVPDRPVTFQISPRPGQNWRGNVVLRVDLLETGEDASAIEVGQATLPFLVKVKQNLLVASKLIRHGDLIGPDNTAVEPVDASYMADSGYASLDEAAGLKARSPIGEGKPIQALMLERPPVIKRGDIIKLLVRAGLVQVSVAAVALRDAAVGDSIPVEVQDSKKQIQAVVQDARTAVSDTR